MADLFEKCLKNAEPTQRKMDSNMLQIRKLDIKFQAKENEAKQKLTQLVNNWKKLSKDEQQRNYKAIEASFAEAKELCQRKIAIASETYEFVDEFIQKLDSDTAKFNVYMVHKHGGDGRLPPGTSAASSNTELELSSVSRKQRRATAPNSTLSSTKRGHANRKQPSKTLVDEDDEEDDEDESMQPSTSNMAAMVNAHGDMPVDPNEPRYCICQQVSFGNMVGCDNKMCPLEWFHFSCVGLTASPKGKWYCPRCRENKDVKKMQRSASISFKAPKRGKSVQHEEED